MWKFWKCFSGFILRRRQRDLLRIRTTLVRYPSPIAGEQGQKIWLKPKRFRKQKRFSQIVWFFRFKNYSRLNRQSTTTRTSSANRNGSAARIDSSVYMSAVFWLCLLVQFHVHPWLLSFLPIPVLVFLCKKVKKALLDFLNLPLPNLFCLHQRASKFSD